MGVSINGGTPKSSIWMGFSLTKTIQLLGYPRDELETPICCMKCDKSNSDDPMGPSSRKQQSPCKPIVYHCLCQYFATNNVVDNE